MADQERTSSAKERIVDRTGWPAGPWDSEPDRIEWMTKAGLPALMVRVDHGAWCGYVAVPPGHPDHGKHYRDVEDTIDVHGGLTYADKCSGKVCHVPAPGEPDDVWWFGFDCVHSGDLAPGMGGRMLSPLSVFGFGGSATDGYGSTYRDVAYVRREVEGLARQLAERAS